MLWLFALVWWGGRAAVDSVLTTPTSCKYSLVRPLVHRAVVLYSAPAVFAERPFHCLLNARAFCHRAVFAMDWDSLYIYFALILEGVQMPKSQFLFFVPLYGKACK